MARSTSITRIILLLFVIVLGIGVGAGLYEARVIMPLWSSAPPESVWGWRDLLAANPQYAPRAGDRFWILLSPLRASLALAVLVTGLRLRGEQRKWRLISSIITLALFILAVAWLIPTSAELFGVNSRQISPDQVISKTKTWVLLNYLFQVLGIVAFLSGLRALSTRATEANV